MQFAGYSSRQVYHDLLRPALSQHHDGEKIGAYYCMYLVLLHGLWHYLHSLLWIHLRHHLSHHYVFYYVVPHGLAVHPYVPPGSYSREENSCFAWVQLCPSTNQHERSHHSDYASWHLHRLLGSVLPSSHPDDLLPSKPLLCLLHVSLQHVPHSHHVQLSDRPLDLRLS